MVQDTNNKEYIKIQFKTISWSLRIPTNYCSKLYVLRVTSALLYSGVCLGYDNVTEVHLSKEKLLKRQKWEREKNEQERKGFPLWETNVFDFLTQTVKLELVVLWIFWRSGMLQGSYLLR